MRKLFAGMTDFFSALLCTTFVCRTRATMIPGPAKGVECARNGREGAVAEWGDLRSRRIFMWGGVNRVTRRYNETVYDFLHHYKIQREKRMYDV